MLVATDMLLDIAQEENGYRFGAPWRATEFSLAAVVPILRDTSAQRGYRLASEVGKKIVMKDPGQIDKVVVTNKSEVPVLLKSGELVGGATQTRALVCSQVIFPGETIKADCTCAYSSKGIRAGAFMGHYAMSPQEIRSTLFRGFSAVGKGKRKAATFLYDGGLQTDVWTSVREHSDRTRKEVGHFTGPDDGVYMPWRTPAEDLAGRLREGREKFKAILEKIPREPNQVGMVVMPVDGVSSLECFEHPESWTALREALLGAEVGKIASASDSESLFEFRPDRARELIRKVLQEKYEPVPAVEREKTTTFLLQSKEYTGELVLLEDEPIHLVLLRRKQS